jgi:hypothetical protein
MFVATASHDLWRNRPDEFLDGMSVGFHPHHRRLELLGVHGVMENWRAVEEKDEPEFFVSEYLHRSAIRTGEIAFTLRRAGVGMKTVRYEEVREGTLVSMESSELHTVAVPRSETAAWFVLSYEEDPEYLPLCFSASDLTNFDGSKIYSKATERELQSLFESIRLIDR